MDTQGNVSCRTHRGALSFSSILICTFECYRFASFD
jgi:hypothetical protein